MHLPNLDILHKSVISGDRVALGQAITLVESNKDTDRKQAGKLLAGLLKHTGKSIRIGITGVPGVGKSTFIEALGSMITSQGKKLAVLAIDPSSPQSKGSILGDKTRMNKLASNPLAFIRPSPTRGKLGGVANNSMETILLCEAAGYDVIIIETVGVGQSELAVKNMTDVFLLLMLAGAGDELQGIKRGIMEMADLLVINKADGENVIQAKLASKVYENALHLFSPKDSGWVPKVFSCSSTLGTGIKSIWHSLLEFQSAQLANGLLESNRKKQKKHWLHHTLDTEMMQRIRNDASIKPILHKLEGEIMSNRITPLQAVDKIMEVFFKKL